MNEASSKVASEHSFFADEQIKPEKEQNKNQIDFSKNSSNPEGIFDTLNKEIRLVVENCKDLSYYSNSNSKISEQQQYNEQFLDSRYWCVRNNNNNENDSFNIKEKKNVLKKNIKNENNKKCENNKNFEDEKIIYMNNEDEEEDKNNFNDDIFDEENMEEKNLEKRENGINEINSIKINKNNLNNKDKEFDDLNNSKCFTEPEDKYIILNKLNSNTPNKINQPFFPKLYNNQQVHSFISTFNNYPSSFGKGSFISTNNSSNNKIKKEEDHSSEEEIKINNNNINNINNINIDEIKNKNNNYYNHGNKFGPHLRNFNNLSNNIEFANINNNPSFNMNNNFLYNRIPKMNLNMVYYIPVQQQPFSSNMNYINNNKIYSNINNIITDNNTNNSVKNKIKDNHNQNINKIQLNNKVNEIKTNNNSSSKENSKKEDSINNTTNNYKNNNNYKNGSYKQNETNLMLNLNNSNTPTNKGEKNLLNLDDIVLGKDTRTTVMIRNIPIKYTDDILIEELKEFKGKFDCLYMPFDYEKKGNKGYAFINFVNPLHILYFHEQFNGKKWQLFESSKICELNSANFQGIYEIQKHSKNYKGYKKPLFYNDQNKNNKNENVIIPSKYLLKLKARFPNMKYHENKVKKIFIIDSFE